jgi:heme exporter protein A
LWLLDEPFAALDAAGRALVLDLIAEHRARGGIVIAAMHEALGIDAARIALGSG